MGRVFDFVANSQDGVFVVDGDQTIVLWNESATAILGYRPDEVLGRHCFNLVGGRDLHGRAICRHHCHAIATAAKLGMPPTMDLRVKTKRGQEIWLNLSTIVVPSRRGELSALIHLFRDGSRDRDFVHRIEELTEAARLLRSFSDDGPAGRTRTDGAALTPREREIVSLLAMGGSTDRIAERLCISPRTVRNHVNNVLGKLGVHSRLEAVTYSMRNGLV